MTRKKRAHRSRGARGIKRQEVIGARRQKPKSLEPRLIVFFIALERPLGLPHGLSLTAERTAERVPWATATDGNNFVTMIVRRTPQPVAWRAELDDMALRIANAVVGSGSTGASFTIPAFGGEQLGTVIELQTPMIIPSSGDIDEAHSLAFDRALEELQRVIIAYSFVDPHPALRPVTRQTCRFMVPMTTMHLDGSYDPLRLFGVHLGATQVPGPVNELDGDSLNRFRITWQNTVARYPFIPFFERVRSAQRAWAADGDYAACVIAAYTACEVLLNTTLLLMAWEEDKSRDETRPWFDLRLQFMNRISREIQPRLGGNWATPAGTSPMDRLAILSHLRQQVAHVAYLPREDEAVDALDTLGVLEEFVKARLAVKRRAYPRTSLLLNGEPGLRRRSAWDIWMENWMHEHAYEDEWGRAFRRWRDGVNDAATATSDTIPE